MAEYQFYSKSEQVWDFSVQGFWIGGHFPVSNLSRGYHGLLRQWWEHHLTKLPEPRVLLITENSTVKQEFIDKYPDWRIETLDLFPEIAPATPEDCDIFGDIANSVNPLAASRYDLILNQATLEHVYNPFGAMKNLFEALAAQGILLTHTHPPGFPYHACPRDYFRFQLDWWVDLPNHFPDVEVLELCQVDEAHVFSCYQKLMPAELPAG